MNRYRLRNLPSVTPVNATKKSLEFMELNKKIDIKGTLFKIFEKVYKKKRPRANKRRKKQSEKKEKNER